MAVDLQRWRYFLVTAEELNVGRAAKRLLISQPSLSQQIRRLERDLGVLLFVRGPRGLTLTPAGAAFASAAQDALTAVADARSAARRAAEGLSATLRVGLVGPVPDQLVAATLARFAKAHPGTELVARQPCFPDHVDAVRSGAVDVAFVFPPYHDDPGIVLASVRHERRVVALRAGHPLAGRASVRFVDIEHEPLPGYYVEPDEAWRHFWTAAQQRTDPPRFVGRTDSIGGVLALVSAGSVVALFPESVGDVVPTPGVHFLPVEDLTPCELALAWRVGAAQQPLVDAFVATARSAVAAA